MNDTSCLVFYITSLATVSRCSHTTCKI